MPIPPHAETHTPALGVPGVRHVSAETRFQNLKLKFTEEPCFLTRIRARAPELETHTKTLTEPTLSSSSVHVS